MSSSFQSQPDVQTERSNRTFEKMISNMWHTSRTNGKGLPALWFSYITSKHRATDKSPFYICTCRDSVKFDELLQTTGWKSPAASEHVADLQSRPSAAADSIGLYNKAMESQANKSRRTEEDEVEERVLLSTRFFKPSTDVVSGRKLAPKYAGTYEVVKKFSRSPTSCSYHKARMLTQFSTHLYYVPTRPTPWESAGRPSMSLSALKDKSSMLSKRFYSPVSTVARKSTWCTGRVTIPMTLPRNHV
jgi:hypothetical protein